MVIVALIEMASLVVMVVMAPMVIFMVMLSSVEVEMEIMMGFGSEVVMLTARWRLAMFFLKMVSVIHFRSLKLYMTSTCTAVDSAERTVGEIIGVLNGRRSQYDPFSVLDTRFTPVLTPLKTY